MEKIKQNKKVVAFIVISIMIFSIFSIPVIAIDDTMYSTSIKNDDYNNTNNIVVRSTNDISSGSWDNQPLPVIDDITSQKLADYGYIPCGWGFNNNNGYYCMSSSNNNTYVCMSSSNKFVLASDSHFTLYYLAKYNNGTPTGNYITNNSGYDSSSELYFIVFTTSGPTSPYYCPVYSSDSEAKQALIEIVNNVNPTDTNNLNYSLPPGNAAFIEVASDNSFTLNTRFNEMSGLFNGVFSKTSQTWGWSSTIVESGSFPLSGHNLIPWAKGNTQNLLGQSHYGYASSNSLSGTGKYLVIYNPLYSYQTDSESNFEHNFSIDISCTSVYSISIVSLKGNLASGIESSWSLTSTPDGTVYTDNGIDSDTGIPTFVNQNGEDAIPEYGGSNFVATQTESFKEWLNSVVGSFLSIFTAGENAIMTLVHSGQGFFSILTSLYAWLPQSVFSVLTSGIVLVITIGIIKVFL